MIRKLVAIPTGDGILPQNWLSLTTQPEYARLVDRLRTVEGQIMGAQHAGNQAESDRLQSDRVEVEAALIRVTEQLHQELKEMLDPSARAFVRSILNALEVLIRWQAIVSTIRLAVQATGFCPSAIPHRVTVEAILNCDLKPALVLLVGQAQTDGALTSAEAVGLLSGKQIDPWLPSIKESWLPGVINGPGGQ
jgi:hypothetical protein